MAAPRIEPKQPKELEPVEPEYLPEVLELTAEETVWLYDLLDSPAKEPTEAMLRAAARRRELFGK